MPVLLFPETKLSTLSLSESLTTCSTTHCEYAQSCSTICDLMEYISVGFSRPEYWGGVPFPPPGDLPDPGIEAMSPALADWILYT